MPYRPLWIPEEKTASLQKIQLFFEDFFMKITRGTKTNILESLKTTKKSILLICILYIAE